MRLSIEIGRIMGIPIRLHITLLLVLPLFAYIFSTNEEFGFAGVPSESLRYLLSFTATVAIFISILLHELSHSVVALRKGLEVKSITLFLFGGLASIEDIPKNPAFEFKMALHGPLASLGIGLVLIAIHYGLLKVLGESMYNFFEIIGIINIVLFIFNMIPAFPMDGGRVLRAWLASRMSYIEATKKAVAIGQVLAVAMGIFGLLGYNPWLVLIAFFIYIGASEEGKATEMTVPLEGVRVSDLMTRDVITVPSSMSVSELVELMLEKKHMGYPVVEDHELVGVVTFTDVQKIPHERRDEFKVRDIMTRNIISVQTDDPAEIALRLLFTHNIGHVLVMNKNHLVGIVSRTDVLRAAQILGS
ncbi:MAG: CBS domain-containing protein [Methanosarcinales archaeon]